MAALRKLRLHLEHRDGTLRKAVQVFFTAKDASLYLVPYSRSGDYYYGREALAAGETTFEIKFREHTNTSEQPKLSIHESGDVHIYATGLPKAGPVKIPPLTDLRGEHIAGVSWDRIDVVPLYAGTTKTTGEQRDVAFGVPDDVEGGALAIYANGERNLFMTEHVHFAVQVERPGGAPVFFGFTAVARDPLGEQPDGVPVRPLDLQRRLVPFVDEPEQRVDVGGVALSRARGIALHLLRLSKVA